MRGIMLGHAWVKIVEGRGERAGCPLPYFCQILPHAHDQCPDIKGMHVQRPNPPLGDGSLTWHPAHMAEPQTESQEYTIRHVLPVSPHAVPTYSASASPWVRPVACIFLPPGISPAAIASSLRSTQTIGGMQKARSPGLFASYIVTAPSPQCDVPSRLTTHLSGQGYRWAPRAQASVLTQLPLLFPQAQWPPFTPVLSKCQLLATFLHQHSDLYHTTRLIIQVHA